MLLLLRYPTFIVDLILIHLCTPCPKFLFNWGYCSFPLIFGHPIFEYDSYCLPQLKTWIEEGVRDFSISRASVEWGIKIPNDPDQTIYVWFDALLG